MKEEACAVCCERCRSTPALATCSSSLKNVDELLKGIASKFQARNKKTHFFSNPYNFCLMASDGRLLPWPGVSGERLYPPNCTQQRGRKEPIRRAVSPDTHGGFAGHRLTVKGWPILVDGRGSSFGRRPNLRERWFALSRRSRFGRSGRVSLYLR